MAWSDAARQAAADARKMRAGGKKTVKDRVKSLATKEAAERHAEVLTRGSTPQQMERAVRHLKNVVRTGNAGHLKAALAARGYSMAAIKRYVGVK